jgi:hypothetical protein
MTKKIIIQCSLVALILTASPEAWASSFGEKAKLIYQSLGVEEVQENPELLGVDIHHKQVGGLICKKSRGVFPGATDVFSCDLGDQANFGAIYEALNVEAVHLNPGFAGIFRGLKSVGGLECVKTILQSSPKQPTYRCQLNLQD